MGGLYHLLSRIDGIFFTFKAIGTWSDTCRGGGGGGIGLLVGSEGGIVVGGSEYTEAVLQKLSQATFLAFKCHSRHGVIISIRPSPGLETSW